MAPSIPKMNTKSNDASLTLPFDKAAKGIVISWILHKNKGNSYNHPNGSFPLIHVITILNNSNESIKIAAITNTLFFSFKSLLAYFLPK